MTRIPTRWQVRAPDGLSQPRQFIDVVMADEFDIAARRIAHLESALVKIRDQDYRGHPCTCAGIARAALATEAL